MKFTEEQYKELGDFHLDDLPFDTDQEDMLRVLNALPRSLQGNVVSWGFSDTLTCNKIFEYLIANQFSLSVKDYYSRKILDGPTIKIDFEKLEK